MNMDSTWSDVYIQWILHAVMYTVDSTCSHVCSGFLLIRRDKESIGMFGMVKCVLLTMAPSYQDAF